MRELIVIAVLIGLGLTLFTIPDSVDRQRVRDGISESYWENSY